MASLRDQLGGLVYSTEHGKTCPTCREALDACNCDNASELERLAALDGVVRIRRETSGRKGKGVTTVSGIPLPSDDLKRLKRLNSGVERVARLKRVLSKSKAIISTPYIRR